MAWAMALISRKTQDFNQQNSGVDPTICSQETGLWLESTSPGAAGSWRRPGEQHHGCPHVRGPIISWDLGQTTQPHVDPLIPSDSRVACHSRSQITHGSVGTKAGNHSWVIDGEKSPMYSLLSNFDTCLPYIGDFNPKDAGNRSTKLDHSPITQTY